MATQSAFEWVPRERKRTEGPADHDVSYQTERDPRGKGAYRGIPNSQIGNAFIIGGCNERRMVYLFSGWWVTGTKRGCPGDTVSL